LWCRRETNAAARNEWNGTVTYFDHNATTPLLPEARQAWLEACDQFIGNPSSPHRLGSRADNALNEAREKLAAFLGCHAGEIVFTSGATESNNTVLHHVARTCPCAAGVWVSSIEHPSLLGPAQFYFGQSLRLIPAGRDGVADLHWIEQELKRSRPALIAVMAANNETGALQPWCQVLQLCREHGVPFFCDAVQWLGKLAAGGLGACDWVTGSAHKFGGPRGAGFVKVPAPFSIVPLLRGGPQEEMRRAGTENVAGALAMVAALEAREKRIAQPGCGRLTGPRDDFERNLPGSLPGAQVVSAQVPRLWNTVSALMPEADCQRRWVVKLDKLGFAVSTGSACSSGKEEPSHVLRAMSYPAADAGRVLRFSAGWETTPNDWDTLLRALSTIAKQSSESRQKILAKSAAVQ
jgi:cysteine desulfurase